MCSHCVTKAGEHRCAQRKEHTIQRNSKELYSKSSTRSHKDDNHSWQNGNFSKNNRMYTYQLSSMILSSLVPLCIVHGDIKLLLCLFLCAIIEDFPYFLLRLTNTLDTFTLMFKEWQQHQVQLHLLLGWSSTVYLKYSMSMIVLLNYFTINIL